jgi:Zn-dependent M28 family amino/carboxypeptidase
MDAGGTRQRGLAGGGPGIRSIGASHPKYRRKKNDESPQIIFGAHYDSRMFADNDADAANHSLPVPGANDGASGVAVLLELARSLPKDSAPIWLVFFDAEDNGNIEGWDWILGSREFVNNNSLQPARSGDRGYDRRCRSEHL